MFFQPQDSLDLKSTSMASIESATWETGREIKEISRNFYSEKTSAVALISFKMLLTRITIDMFNARLQTNKKQENTMLLNGSILEYHTTTDIWGRLPSIQKNTLNTLHFLQYRVWHQIMEMSEDSTWLSKEVDFQPTRRTILSLLMEINAKLLKLVPMKSSVLCKPKMTAKHRFWMWMIPWHQKLTTSLDLDSNMPDTLRPHQ